MNRESSLTVIHDSIDELNEMFALPDALGKSPETVLYGSGAVLDSLGLVNFVSILEEKCESDLGLSVSIMDSSDSGGDADPLRSIGALTDYLVSLAGA